jgi:hypothetical protein
MISILRLLRESSQKRKSSSDCENRVREEKIVNKISIICFMKSKNAKINKNIAF